MHACTHDYHTKLKTRSVSHVLNCSTIVNGVACHETTKRDKMGAKHLQTPPPATATIDNIQRSRHQAPPGVLFSTTAAPKGTRGIGTEEEHLGLVSPRCSGTGRYPRRVRTHEGILDGVQVGVAVAGEPAREGRAGGGGHFFRYVDDFEAGIEYAGGVIMLRRTWGCAGAYVHG